MRKLLFFLLAFHLAPLLSAAESGLKRYLYLSTPDGAQEGGSGNGILVFDIDNGHRFVRRIGVEFKEGLRGFCGNVKRHAVYYTTTNRRLGAFDVESEKILWEKQYDSGCDRACITPDGKKLYVPTGWWLKMTNSGFLVVNADNGELWVQNRCTIVRLSRRINIEFLAWVRLEYDQLGAERADPAFGGVIAL